MDKESLQAIFEFVISKIDPKLAKINGPIWTKEKDGSYKITLEFCEPFQGQSIATLNYDFNLRKLSDEDIFESIAQSFLNIFGMILGTTLDHLKKSTAKVDYVV